MMTPKIIKQTTDTVRPMISAPLQIHINNVKVTLRQYSLNILLDINCFTYFEPEPKYIVLDLISFCRRVCLMKKRDF